VSKFEIHTIESAPEGSATALRALEEALGFVPNLAAGMAESPTLVTGFVDLRKELAGGELTGVEREIVALGVSLEGGYSRAALFDVIAQVGHTTLANLAHSISKAPVDSAFEPQAWARAKPRESAPC
jgi:hypothetical protein